jgi:hypothetical protein
MLVLAMLAAMFVGLGTASADTITYASTGVLAHPTISVANGTAVTDAIAALDPTVGVVSTEATADTATIAWTIANYDATVAGDYTATGVLTLPAGWTGTPADVIATVTVEPAATLDSDATLSDLQVDGRTVSGFSPNLLNYNVGLAAGTTIVPTVTATVNDTGNASALITPATSLPGATTVLVTAQNLTTSKIYTVNFTVIMPATFSDVSTSYWGYNAISSLGSKGIVSGYPDGTFKPEASITRAEFATMLVRALGLNTSGTTSTFTDVTADAWYYGYVNAAASANLVAGIGGNMFAPNALITREQMAVMVVNALGTKAPTIAGTELNAFSDKAAVSSWAVSGVDEAVKAGIVSGMTADTLVPLANATRAQAAEMIYNLLPILGK